MSLNKVEAWKLARQGWGNKVEESKQKSLKPQFISNSSALDNMILISKKD